MRSQSSANRGCRRIDLNNGHRTSALGQRLTWLGASADARRASVRSASSELPAATAMSAARPNDPRAAFARATHPETRNPSQDSMIRNTLRMLGTARSERAMGRRSRRDVGGGMRDDRPCGLGTTQRTRAVRDRRLISPRRAGGRRSPTHCRAVVTRLRVNRRSAGLVA